MLIIFSGLPGVGKTTLSKELSKKLGAFYLRIDTIEQAILNSSLDIQSAEEAGYAVAYQIAADNLRNKSIVIADGVNLVEEARQGWLDVANNKGHELIEVQIICSDKGEHKHRVENRVADISNHKMLTWDDVLNVQRDDFREDILTIDTAKNTKDKCLQIIMDNLSEQF